jgi:hypothetical protein
LRLIYILSLFAAAIQCIRSRYHEKAPLFFWSVVCSIFAEIPYQRFSPEWQAIWYPSIAGIVLAMRIFATGEAFLLSAKCLRLITASTAGSAATIFALIVAWQFTAGSSLYNAVQVRRVALVWMAAFLGTYILFLASKRRWCGTHVFLVFLLDVALAIAPLMRPYFSWEAIDAIAFSVCSAIYVSWAILISLRQPADARYS